MISVIYCFHLQALICLTNGNETPKLPPAGPGGRGAHVFLRACVHAGGELGAWGATCLLAPPRTPPPPGAPAGFEPPGCLVKFMGVPSPLSLHATVSGQMRSDNVQQLGSRGPPHPHPRSAACDLRPRDPAEVSPQGTCSLR